MSAPRLTISVGGGGVGKTTTSAALALAMARAGSRTLVITVDPARRLADALGASIGQATRPAPIDPRAEGRLFAKMPDPRESIDDFMAWLFVDEVQRRRVMQNPAYAELSDSLAGVHELLTVGLLQTEIDSGNFDEIVLDTAPSRHALGFLTYPSRLLELLEARALSWLASAAEATREDAPRRGFLSWGRSKVEGVFGRLVGASAVRNLAALFGELASVRERWAELARKTDRLLGDPRTRYLLVGAPSGGAIADIAYLSKSLARRRLRPTAIVLNRAEREPPACEAAVRALLDAGTVREADRDVLKETLDQLASEHRARAYAAAEATRELEVRLGRSTRVIRLPFVGPAQPNEIVLALADAWAEAKLLGSHSGGVDRLVDAHRVEPHRRPIVPRLFQHELPRRDEIRGELGDDAANDLLRLLVARREREHGAVLSPLGGDVVPITQRAEIAAQHDEQIREHPRQRARRPGRDFPRAVRRPVSNALGRHPVRDRVRRLELPPEAIGAHQRHLAVTRHRGREQREHALLRQLSDQRAHLVARRHDVAEHGVDVVRPCRRGDAERAKDQRATSQWPSAISRASSAAGPSGFARR